MLLLGEGGSWIFGLLCLCQSNKSRGHRRPLNALGTYFFSILGLNLPMRIYWSFLLPLQPQLIEDPKFKIQNSRSKWLSLHRLSPVPLSWHYCFLFHLPVSAPSDIRAANLSPIGHLCINHASPNQGRGHLCSFVDVHGVEWDPVTTFFDSDRQFRCKRPPCAVRSWPHQLLCILIITIFRSIDTPAAKTGIGNLATPHDESYSHDWCIILSASDRDSRHRRVVDDRYMNWSTFSFTEGHISEPLLGWHI